MFPLHLLLSFNTKINSRRYYLYRAPEPNALDLIAAALSLKETQDLTWTSEKLANTVDMLSRTIGSFELGLDLEHLPTAMPLLNELRNVDLE